MITSNKKRLSPNSEKLIREDPTKLKELNDELCADAINIVASILSVESKQDPKDPKDVIKNNKIAADIVKHFRDSLYGKYICLKFVEGNPYAITGIFDGGANDQVTDWCNKAIMVNEKCRDYIKDKSIKIIHDSKKANRNEILALQNHELENISLQSKDGRY